MSKAIWLKSIDETSRADYAREIKVLVQYISETSQSPETPFKKTSLGRQLDSELRNQYVVLVRAALLAIAACRKDRDEPARHALQAALASILRRKVELTESDVTSLLRFLSEIQLTISLMGLLRAVLDTIERVTGWRNLATEQRHRLAGLREQLVQFERRPKVQTAKLVKQIDELLNPLVSARLHADEGWADDLQRWLAKQTPDIRDQWDAFLRDAAAVRPAAEAKDWRIPFVDITGGVYLRSEPAWRAAHETYYRLQLALVPCSEWKEKMQEHITRLGPECVAERLRYWLNIVPDSKPGMLARESLNREMLRGLLYLCCEFSGSETADNVSRATKFFFKNNSPLAGTGIIVLYHLASKAAMAALASVAQIRLAAIQSDFVRFVRTELAHRLNLDPDDIGDEEISSLGFTGLGELRKEFGTVRATLSISGGRTSQIVWSREGKILRTIPASVKHQQQSEIQGLKATAKEAQQFLDGLGRRIESMWLERRQMNLDSWRRQLIDHVVAGVIGRKLIWRFGEGTSAVTAYWRDNGLVDAKGHVVPFPDAGPVAPWHPLHVPKEEVLAWRGTSAC
jgi:hypothetical protein